jgi:hypothetical protein
MDLQIAPGRLTALVSGSRLYQTHIAITPLDPRRWKEIAAACTGQIDSLVDLIQGNLSDAVMEVVTHRERGLFPAPAHIALDCSCPDWADMCKHVAAVLYGVGARLDDRPELLFTLRGVDHLDLVGQAVEGGALLGGQPAGNRKLIKGADLSALFGIALDAVVVPGATSVDPTNPVKRANPVKTTKPAKPSKPTKAAKPSKPAKSAAAPHGRRPRSNAKPRVKSR